jgi:hypothetical protein
MPKTNLIPQGYSSPLDLMQTQLAIKLTKDTFERELADAEAELLDGEQKLADAEKELLDGEQELADGEAEYADGLAELADAKIELEEAKADPVGEAVDTPTLYWDKPACINPKCISATEQELPAVYKLVDERNQIFRCIYCDQKCAQ